MANTSTWLAWNDTSKRLPTRDDADENGRVLVVIKRPGEAAYVNAEPASSVRDFAHLCPKWARIPEPLPGTYGDVPEGATQLNWIKASDRLPTETDTDRCGHVLLRARTSWRGVWVYYSKAEDLDFLQCFWDPSRYWWLPAPDVPEEVI